MENEVWKDIPEYEGLYQVSIYGEVKSLPVGGNGRGKGGWKNERILKCYTNHNNHQYVTLCKNGIGKHQFIHRLVAIAFPEICGEWFKDAQVHHIDFNPSNNKADNLIVISKEEHQLLHNTSDVTFKRRSVVRSNRVVSEETRQKLRVLHLGVPAPNRKRILQYTKDGNFIMEWSCIESAREVLNIQHISDVCNGRRKTAGGFVWKFKN